MNANEEKGVRTIFRLAAVTGGKIVLTPFSEAGP
jgi:hypothetical protein